MSTEAFKDLALTFPGTEAAPHFDRTAFRVVKKRIYATLHEATRTANIVLMPGEQAEFCEAGEGNVYPVPNKWGLQGWTTIDLKTAAPELVQVALELAYEAVLNSGKKGK